MKVLDAIGPATPLPRKPSEIEQYARSVFETASYSLEVSIAHGGGGHSEAWKEIRPKNITDWSACRRVLQKIRERIESGEQNNVCLLDVCRWIAELSGDGCDPAPYTFDEIERMVREKCEWWEPQAIRKMPTDSEKDFSFRTGLMASARYLYRIHLEDMGGGHSRLDIFIPQVRSPGISRKLEAAIATGDSVDEQDEHVVPCAYIRDHCLRQYAQGASVAQIADFIGRHLVVVRMLKTESETLDASRRNGGYGLKTAMPERWRVGDSIFARLHDAEIEFIPPTWYAHH